MICGRCKARGVTKEHVRECYSTCNRVTVEVPMEVPMTDGMFQKDGAIYKVQRSQSSGHLYAKVLQFNPDDPDDNGTFVFVSGAIKNLKPSDKLTLEQAKQYGLLYGACIVCGRTLTDERSIEAGIGPVCAGKGHWA